MAKIRKKRRRLSLFGFAFVFFTFAVFAWILSSLFINTQNTSLTIKIQNMNEEIASIKKENKTLNIEIQSLENKDRIYTIAQSSNLIQNDSNIISIQGD